MNPRHSGTSIIVALTLSGIKIFENLLISVPDSEGAKMADAKKYHSAVLFIVLLIAGCSSGSNPTEPSIENSRVQDGSNQLWGLWSVEIDPAGMKSEIKPIRGAMFNANVLLFMQPPSSPIHMLSISIDQGASDILNNLIVFDVTLRHPFPQFAQFRGFDVRGIFMSGGSVTTGFDASALFPDWFSFDNPSYQNNAILLNADGYTRWWNPTEFTTYETAFGYIKGAFAPSDFIAGATINPYKYFADELESNSPLILNPENRGTFSPDGVNTRRYEVRFESKPLRFNYAVDASWSKPDTDFAPDYPIEAFDLSANCQEAYMISTVDAGSTAWYYSSYDFGGTHLIDIEIFDWQAASPSDVLDEISAIWVESDSFFNSGVSYKNILLDDYELFPGSSVNSAVFRCELSGDFMSFSDSEIPGDVFVIAVESKNPDTYEPQIDGGGGAFSFPASPLAAWQVGQVHKFYTSPPDVDSIDPSSGYVDEILPNVEIAGADFDPDSVVIFEEEATGVQKPPMSVLFVTSAMVQINLDLTGWNPGWYHVTVENPNGQSGTLEHGFEVVEGVPGNLILGEEIHITTENPGYQADFPAITVEYDDDVVIACVEWTRNPDPPFNYRSYAQGYRSQDGGDTWPDKSNGMNTSYINPPWIFGASTKIWPSTNTNTSWRTMNHMDYDSYEYLPYLNWWIGYAETVFDGPYNHETACYAHDIDYANEILQDSDGYVYLFGDRDDIITFKKSELPDRLDGGPTTNMWELHASYEVANPGRLSWARSSALYDEESCFAYYDPVDNTIRLARMSLPDWQDWDISSVIYDGGDSYVVRDPGLTLDESGYHVVFIQQEQIASEGEVYYTFSDDGSSWTEPVLVESDYNTVWIACIDRYDSGGNSVLAVMYWASWDAWVTWSPDNGQTWSVPQCVSEMYTANFWPDMIISDTGDWHFVFSSMNPSSMLMEIQYRKAYFNFD